MTIVLAAIAMTSLALALWGATRRRIAVAALALAASLLCSRLASYAYADDGGATSAAVVDAGVGAGSASGAASGIATSPAPSTPGGIWDRLVTDWHDGKLLDATLLVLLALVMLAKQLPKVGPWLSTGSRTSLVSAGLMALTTGISTLATKTVTLGWLQGAVMAGFLLWLKSHDGPPAQAALAGPGK